MLQHNRQGFIAWFIRQAIDGETIELFGEGKQCRDLNHVDDVVEALLSAGASEAVEGEILNLGGVEPISLAALAAELISITGRGSVHSVPFPAERQLIEIGNFYCDSRKIENLLGWQPRVPLREGLERTIEFYQEHRAQYWEPNANTFPRSEAGATRG